MTVWFLLYSAASLPPKALAKSNGFQHARRAGVVAIMVRMNDWQRDIYEAKRKEGWSLRGPKQIVKVLPSGRDLSPHLGGYITVGFHLLGKTPRQIEGALGLPKNHLRDGARIYRFNRLPLIEEYEYELTADQPGGLAYDPVHNDPAYLPGSPKIHQWRIRPGLAIPVDTTNFLDLKPGERFPYNWLTSP